MVTLGFVACAGIPPRAEDHLYVQLGGEQGIEALVDQFLEELADDRRVAPHFAETNIPRFRRLLIEQFCVLAGGPCEYTGDTMRESHAGLDIREGEFNALVEDLIHAMEKRGLPVGAQNRLLALLAPMHADIVGR